MGNIVAIVGRPNVGKSTLFNRLTGTRQAIVNEEAGTTRDRQYGKVEWTGKEFSLIDTGGWVVNSEDVFEEEINKQVKVAIEEADVILFVVDVLNGITDLDMEVAQILRRCKRPVIVVANKADNYDLHPASAEFYSFGLGEPFCISAINGSYTGDLLDKIVATLPEEKEVDEVLHAFERDLPESVSIRRIADQPKVVGDSVSSFVRDLFVSIVVVILVMMVLFPFRSALVAATSIPISVFISIGVMYACGIPLNTVTLAALIVVLILGAYGMGYQQVDMIYAGF